MLQLPNYTFTEYLRKTSLVHAATEAPFNCKEYLEKYSSVEESPTICYILDYRTGKDHHFSKNAKRLTGFDSEVFLAEGIVFTIQQYNQQDAEVCFNTVFPKHLRFFLNLEHNSLRDYSFQYSFRFLDKDQHFMTIMQESIVLERDNNGPLIIMGFWTDITPFKEDASITAVINYRRSGEPQQLIEAKHYFPTSGDGILSVRELQILRLVLEGYSSEAIAQNLHISRHTVLTHRAHIREKTKARNVADLLRYATLHKII